MLKLSLFFALVFFNFAYAQNYESLYSKIDFDNTCLWEKPASEEEAGMGGSAVCDGLIYKGNHWPVHFAEGDLRQFVSFGHLNSTDTFIGGFAQWNSINDTIEWRMRDGKPFATVLRWFIDNIDPDTGSADKNRRGNVLVISKVAHSIAQGGDGKSCTVGYVDARANNNANQLATQIADEYAWNFSCGEDEPRFYGKRGKNSGTPNDLAKDQRRY